MTTATVSQRVDKQVSHVLYNGKVNLDFDPVKHRYYINGEYAYGVTTALSIINKPFLLPWAVNKATEYIKENLVPGVAIDELQIQKLLRGAKNAYKEDRDGAADLGTYIHNWIEDYVNGRPPQPPVNDRMEKVVNDFLEWWESQNIEVLKAERMLCSPKHMLAGTPDLICRVDGKLTIMDWKTGSGIYKEAFMQMAAYAMMLEEEHPEQKVEQLYIVNASARNMFKTMATEDIDFYKKAYMDALTLYKSNKEAEEKFNKEAKNGGKS